MAVIPPWQNADEPQHMASVLLAANGGDVSTLPVIEQEIISSMAENRWWEYYGRPLPSPLPSRFENTMFRNRVIEAKPYYHDLVGALLGSLPAASVSTQIQRVRALSALMVMLALVCCWLAARQCVPDFHALVPTAVLALHPQIAIVATTANSDSVLVLAGSLVWWQGLRLIRAGVSISALAALWLAATASALVNERGVLLLPIAAVMSLAGLRGLRRYPVRRWLPILAGLAITGICIGLLLLDPLVNALWYVRLVAWQSDARRTWEYVGQFLEALFGSAWLVAGWGRFPAPSSWLAIMHGVSILAMFGAVRALWKEPSRRFVYLIAAIFVGVLLGAVIVYHLGTMRGGANGRYLFPAMGPMSLLLWIGIRAWFPESRWPVVGMGLIGLVAAFDLVGWLRVLLPAYI